MTREVEFDDVEREWFLALDSYEEEYLCPLCGLPREVCRAYDTDGNVDVAFERCHVASAIARKQRALQSDEGFEPDGLEFSASIRAAPTAV